MNYYSPLRYPGGKGKVADFFKEIIKGNLLYDGVYVEPYAGGASVALSLLLNEYVSKIIINDIDRSIFAFWHSVLYKTDALCRLIMDTPVTLDTWEEQKILQREQKKNDLLSVGFSTFFLNRTNRSGIISGAGMIGGRQQNGKWKIDARYNKPELISRIERIACYKKNIELNNLDAAKLTNSLRKILPQRTLFYFDPPYYVKGKDLYLNYYGDSDHKEISFEIDKVNKQKWIVTYDNVKPIRRLYTNYRQKKFTLQYSAGQSSQGEEVMIFSDNIYIPKHPILGRKK